MRQRPKAGTYKLHDRASEEVNNNAASRSLVDALVLREREMHHAGWNADSSFQTIYVVHDSMAGPPDLQLRRLDSMTAILRTGIDAHDGNTSTAIQEIGEAMLYGRQDGRDLRIPPPGIGRVFRGVALSSEGWALARSDDPDEDQRRVAASIQRRASAHPDRVEVRFIYTATSRGLSWHLMRVRGELPNVWVDGPGEAEKSIAGIPVGLRMICEALSPSSAASVPR